MPEDVLSNLTEQQLAAVTHRDGPMLVVAGAGSGKTRVVTRRIAWLLQNGVWPQQILAMTFTNKAAREMCARVEALTGQIPRNIGTFHSCCARFLRRDIEKLGCGLTSAFTIYDENDREALFKHCMNELPGIPKTFTARQFISTVSRLKNQRCSLVDAMPCEWREDGWLVEAAQNVIHEYNRRLLLNNAVDFDDLLLYMFRLLDEHPEMADIYHSRFRYLLVDEYQDTNHLQYELIMKLANESHNIHVTGDPDQSIYSWRGADYSNIMSFTRDFPDAKVVKLERNYRSTQIILDAANTVIANNADRISKNLFTERAGGTPIWLTATASDRDEAEMLCRRIRKLHGSNPDWYWRDFAILYRTNAQSRAVEEYFVRTGMPYQIFGSLKFYDRKEIRDILALLRLRLNPADTIAFRRVIGAFPCGNGIGDKTLEKLCADASLQGKAVMEYILSPQFKESWCNGKSRRALAMTMLSQWWQRVCEIPDLPVGDAVRKLYALSGYETTLSKLDSTQANSTRENIESLLAKADEFDSGSPEATLNDFLQDVALVADTDGHDADPDGVIMMTLHAAKGLEFQNVFIVGLEENILPHKNALKTFDNDSTTEPPAVQEERRLFYVGITRAERAVYLSYCRSRFSYNGMQSCLRSRFIDELPMKLVKSFEYSRGHEIPVPFHSGEYY